MNARTTSASLQCNVCSAKPFTLSGETEAQPPPAEDFAKELVANLRSRELFPGKAFQRGAAGHAGGSVGVSGLQGQAATLPWCLSFSRGWGLCLDDPPAREVLDFPLVPPGVLYDVGHQCRLQYGAYSTFCDDMDVSCGLSQSRTNSGSSRGVLVAGALHGATLSL